MTTLAVVRKNGQFAIAADTLTKWGSTKESSAYVTNHEKIFKVGDSFLGITGTTTFKLILTEYFSQLETPPKWARQMKFRRRPPTNSVARCIRVR